MQYSHSGVECFESCHYKYKMRYIDRLKTLPPDNADNPLIIGTALHTGVEKGVEAAIQEYYFSYPIITDAHITEAMKLEMQIEKARAVVPKGEHEVLLVSSRFKGFIDLLVPVEPGVYDIWDFKYSNNQKHYMESRQLHLYKHYFEETHPGKRIRKLFFLFVPKNGSKQKKDESLYQYRARVISELAPTQVKAVEVPFDYRKVVEHLELIQDIQQETGYETNASWLNCNYCEYFDYCQKGRNYMILPSAERRNISETKKRKIWIYGAAFSGKTTFLDEAPNPLNLNTDGNIQFVTMPYISIKDEVKVEGRITKRKYAWEVFKEAIAELEKKQNDFETIIIDLLEDTREACRVYMYQQLQIQHESDSGYGKGWDIIKTEYLSTIRRFFNLDYENIVVVSHEDVSKDITKKNGQNITRIAPNIQDAIANKVAGMVDIVARVVVEDDGTRTLNFKSNEVIFGGGRLKGIKQTTIPLSWDALMQVYDEANSNAGKAPVPAAPAKTGRRSRNAATASYKPQDEAETEQAVNNTPETETAQESAGEALGESDAAASSQANVTEDVPSASPSDPLEGAMNPPEEQPKTRTRRSRKTVEEPAVEAVAEPAESPAQEAAPASEPGKRTRRSRKTAE